MFHVYVDGMTATGPNAARQLSEAMAERYGLPAADLYARLTRGRFRVKANVDEATANAYARDLEAIGARVRIEEAQPVPGAPARQVLRTTRGIRTSPAIIPRSAASSRSPSVARAETPPPRPSVAPSPSSEPGASPPSRSDQPGSRPSLSTLPPQPAPRPSLSTLPPQPAPRPSVSALPPQPAPRPSASTLPPQPASRSTRPSLPSHVTSRPSTSVLPAHVASRPTGGALPAHLASRPATPALPPQIASRDHRSPLAPAWTPESSSVTAAGSDPGRPTWLTEAPRVPDVSGSGAAIQLGALDAGAAIQLGALDAGGVLSLAPLDDAPTRPVFAPPEPPGVAPAQQLADVSPPAPAADPFAPPAADTDDFVVELADDERAYRADKRITSPPILGGEPVARGSAPSVSAEPAARPDAAAIAPPVAPAAAPLAQATPERRWMSARARFAAGVLLAIILGFLPAHIVASLREDRADRAIDARVTAAQAAVDSRQSYDALDALRAEQLDAKRRAHRSIVLTSLLVWGAAGGAIAFVWFKRIPWQRLG